MASLQVLVNIILQQYFLNNNCIINIEDNATTNRVKLNIPSFSIDLSKSTVKLPQCQVFFINVEHAIETIENIENAMRFNSTFQYNSRAYLIVANNNLNKMSFKNKIFTYISNILLLKVAGFEKNQYYELYTHNYKDQRGNNKGVLLNIWFPQNRSFLSDNINLFPNREKNLNGRTFINAFVNNPPYIDLTKCT